MLKSILRFEWLFWTAACVIAVFQSPADLPFFIGLPIFALLRWLAGEMVWPPKQIAFPLIGLLVAVAISAVVTPDLAHSLRQIGGLLNGIGLFVALTTGGGQISAGGKRWLLPVLGLLIAGAGALGADIQARIPLLFPLFRGFYKIVPLFPNVTRVINANQVAGALLWTLPPTIGIALFFRQQKQRPAAFALALLASIQMLMMLIMQSRAALLGLFFGGLWFMWLMLPTGRKAIRNLLLTLVTIVVLALLPIWPSAVTDTVQERYFALFVKGDEGDQGTDSIEARLKIWQRSAEKIGEKPLLGYGLNVFRTIANDPTPVFTSAKAIPHAHNLILQIILGLGFFGLFFYGWLWVLAGVRLKQRWKEEIENRPIIAGLSAALLAFFVFGLLDTISPGSRPDFVFWVLLATIFQGRESDPIT